MNTQQKIVLSLLGAAFAVSGQRTISYKEIAQITGLQETMVSSCLRILERGGYITKVQTKTETGRLLKNTYYETAKFIEWSKNK